MSIQPNTEYLWVNKFKWDNSKFLDTEMNGDTEFYTGCSRSLKLYGWYCC